ncbi:hypothetical protein IT400_04495 [Candidatus Nomurabacteria bacterium]|nr:hypothetical protein [Candidatus Nomurabacteria bacterium]
MTKQNCKTCEKEFVIRDEDIVFYEQMKSPLPLHCPDCRMMRRLAYRNERTLYKRPCDLCNTDGVSIYPPATTPFPVYCHTCWWSDKWDPRDFAMDYDPSRPFLEQFKELQAKVPRIALLVIDSVRCDYTNNAGENKDCYLIFAAENNEDCMYGRLVQRCKTSNDCAFIYDSELCYECIDCRACFKCMYSEQCQSSSDLLFCYNMRDSQNCILCTNGRHMSNAILNVKYGKVEFEKKKAEILSSYENIEEAKKQYEELKSKCIVKYAFQNKCHDATGDYMYNCHEGVRLFDTSDSKNCSYMADAMDIKDSMDCNNFYIKCEFEYDMMGVLGGSKNKHGTYVMWCTSTEYCDSCYNSNDLFGCIRLNKDSYSILNKKYEKESFDKLRAEIIESMKADGSYGQFFPPEMSPFGYNETLAKEYFPMTRDEALAKNFRWQEKNTGTFGKETMPENTIPSSITSVTDTILSEILACNECGKNFRVIKAELDFYKRMGLPIPHKDFECRHQARMAKRNPRKLYPGKCMCGSTGSPSTMTKHINHPDGPCNAKFETSYGPERKEIIYCESCYNQEIA